MRSCFEEEDVPPLVVVKRMMVENIVVVVELLLDEMHLMECKRREVLRSWRQSKRKGQM
jgi:hypothetical protein